MINNYRLSLQKIAVIVYKSFKFRINHRKLLTPTINTDVFRKLNLHLLTQRLIGHIRQI